jgi:3-oxoacyl-[acyl-carrier-protein] synthase II
MKSRVVITGMGVMSSLGTEIGEFWGNLLEGRSGVSTIENFDITDYPTKIGAEIKHFDPGAFGIEVRDAKRMDRFVQFAVAAAFKALQDAELKVGENIDGERMGVMIGSGVGGIQTLEREHAKLMEKGPRRVSPFFIPMMIANMGSGQVSILTGAKGPNSTTVTACATGTHSIGDSYRQIKYGQADVMICGGAEATITPMAMAGFSNMHAMSTRNDDPTRASRPFDKDRDGFVLGEGAGVLILEALEHAQARGAHIYAEVIGYGMSGDAHHMTDPDPDGAARCMQAALDNAGIAREDIEYINAHGTSTGAGDISETTAIKRTFGEHAYHLAVSSTKSMTGHLLGAAGGIEGIILALSLQHGILLPTINLDNPDPACDLDYVPNVARKQDIQVALSNSFGFGGHNASIVMKKFMD